MCVGGLTGQRSKADVCVCEGGEGRCMSLPHPILLFVLSASQVQFPSVCVCGGGGGVHVITSSHPSICPVSISSSVSFFFLISWQLVC